MIEKNSIVVDSFLASFDVGILRNYTKTGVENTYWFTHSRELFTEGGTLIVVAPPEVGSWK